MLIPGLLCATRSNPSISKNNTASVSAPSYCFLYENMAVESLSGGGGETCLLTCVCCCTGGGIGKTHEMTDESQDDMSGVSSAPAGPSGAAAGVDESKKARCDARMLCQLAANKSTRASVCL